jgi:predicted transposase YbfD/YdcC
MHSASGQSETTEQSRGRTEQRLLRCWNHPSIAEDLHKQGWNNVRAVLEVWNTGIRDGQEYAELHYYITSVVAAPQVYLAMVRLHWQVENNCHRAKDVVFLEDHTPTPDHNANRTLAILRDFAVNVFRLHGHASLKYAIEHFTNLVKELYELLRT